MQAEAFTAKIKTKITSGGGFIRNLINKYRLATILLAAVLTTVLLMLLSRLPDMLGDYPNNITVMEQTGVYTLTDITDWKAAVTLSPGPTYYPDILLAPEYIASTTPVSTAQYDTLHAALETRSRLEEALWK